MKWAVIFHPHAQMRMRERGAEEDEVRATIEQGEQFPATYGRTGFRRNFSFGRHRRGSFYETKQVEAYAEPQGEYWLVVTVVTRFF